jgi:hypothetical protein
MSWIRTVVAPHVVHAQSRRAAAAPAPTSAIAEDKLSAYMETHYSVRAPEPIVMRIGVANGPLAVAMRRHGAATCAFVTAYNPCGQAIADVENHARHAVLLVDLEQLECPFQEGAGGHPDNGWPEEKSCICFGLSFDAACELGAKWGQDAIVWCDGDAVPKLVLLR